jgi:transcription elongation factor GreA
MLLDKPDGPQLEYRDFVSRNGCQKLMSKLPMTAAGHSALEDELKHRIRVERPRLIQRLQEAIADDSNLAENSEYYAAKTEQEINEARIAELEDKLARAEVIDISKLSGDTIKFGATVTLIDEESDEKKVWQIVGEPEADANKGKISVTSPIARALIGKAKGTAVEVEAPGGTKAYKVRKVEWLEASPRKGERL